MAQDRTGASKPRSKRADDGAAHLKQYLTNSNLSYTQFGERVGCTKAHVCGLVNRKSKPSLELAARMEKETDGRIPQASWAAQARARA
jgi:plasmid maintenance system antidote protein VapI